MVAARFDLPSLYVCGDLNMLRCFAGHPAQRVLITTDKTDPSLFSRHCNASFTIPDPAAHPVEALEELERAAPRHGPRPVLYYGTDALLLLISRNRSRLEPRYAFLMPEAERVEELVDKSRFAQLASALSVRTPRTIVSNQYRPGIEIPLPCILKPNRHIGWLKSRAVSQEGGRPRKALYAETKEQLDRALSLLREFEDGFVIQRYVAGDERAILSFHFFADKAARIRASYVGRKIRTYPKGSGVSTYIELVDDPAVARAGAEIAEKLGLVGVAKLDFKRDADTGELYLLEVNPRFNLWNYLGSAAGVNLPAIAYDCLTFGDTDPDGRYRAGMRWLSFGNDARTFLREYRRDGDWGWLEWVGSVLRADVYDVFAWDDPLPFLVDGSRELARVAARVSGWGRRSDAGERKRREVSDPGSRAARPSRTS